MKPIAVVLISGGLDSCVTASIASQSHRVAALHVQYGQKTQAREHRAFMAIAKKLQVAFQLVTNLNHLSLIGGSSLTDPNMEVRKADLKSTEVPTSYVPFRNAHMLCIATSWAEVLGAQAIFIGAVEEDSSGYPDCRQPFFDAFQQTIRLGTKPGTEIGIHTPLIDLSKEQIVRRGQDLGAPLELTWSCYQSDEPACGCCDSCALRLRGFYRAGVEDPITYANPSDRTRYP